MLRKQVGGVMVVSCLLPMVICWGSDALSIKDIQMTEDPNGNSDYHLSIVDCTGGIVIFKRQSKKPRLILIDPNATDGWGGIQVKGWAADVFDDVEIGDWVQLHDVMVEENAGTTFLQFSATMMAPTVSRFTIVSRENLLPHPMVVDVNEIAGPEYVASDDAWISPQHTAERYESMIVQVRDVWVSAMGLGAKNDNYSLQAVDRSAEPVATMPECWVTDYMNRDGDRDHIYMPPVAIDVPFCAVTGMLEQYVSLEDGYDIFQLLTLSNNSFIGLQAADLDLDCDVDLWDAQLMTAQLLGQDSGLEGDLSGDGLVNAEDQILFNEDWQAADLNGDGVVNGLDLDAMPL